MSKKVNVTIAESIRKHAVPIDSLKQHPRNARQGDVGAIVSSLQRFGQVKPIVVQAGTGVIIAGNHTWQAAKELGWTEIAAVEAQLSDRQALALMIADNRTQDLGAYNDDALISVLAELAGNAELDGTGWDGDDVDELLRRTGAMAGGDPSDAILGAVGIEPSTAGSAAPTADPDAGRFGRDADGNAYYALNLPLTAEQRATVLEAFALAKKHGHSTQPAALVAIAEHYMEATR